MLEKLAKIIAFCAIIAILIISSIILSRIPKKASTAVSVARSGVKKLGMPPQVLPQQYKASDDDVAMCQNAFKNVGPDGMGSYYYCMDHTGGNTTSRLIDFTSNDVCEAGNGVAISPDMCATPLMSQSDSYNIEANKLCCASGNCNALPVDKNCTGDIVFNPLTDINGVPDGSGLGICQ